MKRILKIIILCGMILPNHLFKNINTVYSKEVYAEQLETTTYAKALSSCNLYKTSEMKKGLDDILFQVPETYFVTVLEIVNEDCLKVQYDRFVGFVESSSVVVATFTPIVKTLDNITFDIKSTSGTQIWSNPSPKSEIKTTISAGTKNIKYIAYTFGSIPSGGESNIWYYVYYTPDANSTNVYEGYVYSENTTNLTEIVSNTESNPEVIENDFNDEKVIVISSTIKTIVISVIAIPVILFFVVILYKLVQKIKNNTNKHKNLNNSIDDNFNKNSNLIKNNFLSKYKNMRLLKNKNFNENFTEFDDDELL